MNITFEVNSADIRYVENKLKGMEEKAPGAFKNAINRTATKVRKKITSGAKETYAVQDNKTITEKVKTQRASPARLTAYVRARGGPLEIPKFRYEVSEEGVRAEILRGRGLGEPIGPRGRRAFANPAKTEHIMQRTGKTRKPLQAVRTISVPEMAKRVYKGECGSQGSLEPLIQKTLHDEIAAEVARLTR